MSELMYTNSGRHFPPMEMKEEDVAAEDIAHALSLLCRGGGHLKYFYSVGQHCINCAREALARGYGREVALGCLLHDASEAYVSDIIRPVKKYLSNYKEIEDGFLNKIFGRFGLGNLTKEQWDNIWEIDDDLLYNELDEQLNGYPRGQAPALKSKPYLGVCNPADTEKAYMELFDELSQ